MKTSDFLIQTKALIDTPEKWTTNAFARDADGFKTNYTHSDAVCFCTMGAARRYRENAFGCGSGFGPYNDAIAELVKTLSLTDFLTVEEVKQFDNGGIQYIAPFNDNTSHARVMELFDVTIKRLQGEGK